MGQKCIPCLADKDDNTVNFFIDHNNNENNIINAVRTKQSVSIDKKINSSFLEKSLTKKSNNSLKDSIVYYKKNIKHIILIQSKARQLIAHSKFILNKPFIISMNKDIINGIKREYFKKINPSFTRVKFSPLSKSEYFDLNFMNSIQKAYCEEIFNKIDDCSVQKTYKQVLYDKIKISLYEGYTSLDLIKNGYGVYYLQSGEIYEGNWINNEFVGYGRFFDSKGNVFEGLFDNFKLNTFGSVKGNGVEFYGQFVDNLKQGKGKEITSVHEYEGDFYMDEKHGTGKIYYKESKETYEGEFFHNNITGRGTYKWANNDKYSGDFLDGKMHGKDEYLWPEGGRYVGDYIDNIKEGKGVFYWTNGRIYEGQFGKGKPHGKGIIKQYEKSYNVVFENGVLKEKNKIEN